jgi:hypothetical protein
LHTNLVGNGSISAISRYGGGPVTVDGSVDAGITVRSGTSLLTIDQAGKFAGIFTATAVSLPDLIANSYTFDKSTNVITFYENNTIVATLRAAPVNMPSDIYQAYYAPSGSGINLFETSGPGSVTPNNTTSHGTLLPIHT